MSHSRESDVPPGKDVRALFDKANIGELRYRTFAAQKGLQKKEAERTAPLAAEPAPSAPPAHGSQPRRALNAVFEGNARLRLTPSRPQLATGSGAAFLFASCAGGVGKTTLCATVARIMSSRINNVLVADRCGEGIIPYYFSLERLRAGGLLSVYPNARRPGYQMTMVNSPCSEQSHTATAEWLEQLQGESTLTLMDLPTLNAYPARTQLVREGQVIVPLVPDVQSIASLAWVEELSGKLAERPGGRSLFVLNRFDQTRALHREIRAHLEKVLEDQLAPVAVRESESVPEALSLGMTVIDHVPQSPIVQDFEQLVVWLEARLSETSAEKVEIA